MKIIVRKIRANIPNDASEALEKAMLMEECAIQTFCIQAMEDKYTWLVWGRGDKKSLDSFENKEFSWEE